MIFDEIPFELKEHIFTYVPPNEWINTAKVSNEWQGLTLRSIKKVEICHALILDHLAEFINEQRNTNYTWVSLLAMMSKLEHLECFENTEAFWTEISPICDQLKVLDFTLKEIESFDWNQLHISFKNLVALRWDGSKEAPAFLLRIFELAPKLEKITLKCLKINAEWKHKIPRSVKHILLKNVQFLDEHQCSMNNLCEDTSTLETVSALYTYYYHAQRSNVSHFFDAPRLKKLALRHRNASIILENAFTKCPNLETVRIDGYAIHVTDSWRKSFPASVKSFKASGMSVEENIRHDFSFDWLFKNYGALQSLEVECKYWTGLDPQKFHSPKNLKKLNIENYGPYFNDDESIEQLSGVCFHMIRSSHLVEVEIWGIIIDESWRQIFPLTVQRLQMGTFMLTTEAKEIFSPQFICENPSKLEFLFLSYFNIELPAMDLNAFYGMNKLKELHLNSSRVSGECLQSILTHCSCLTHLVFGKLESGALTNIPHNLGLPSLRKLDVNEPVDQPSLLLQHFPKLRKVVITMVPTKECWLEGLKCLQGVETAMISVDELSFDLLWSFIESINETEFKYYYLTVKYAGNGGFFFYLTNSLLAACSNLHRFNSAVDVLWIKNYPTSPLLKERMSNIPSSMDELLQRYNYIMAPKYDTFTIYGSLRDDGSIDDDNDGDGE